jgi:hypothetical protein
MYSQIRYRQVAAVICCALAAQTVHAFGMGDLLSIGIQAGTKLVGAAVEAGVDAAKDALRDPEAEAAKAREAEKKIAEQFDKQKAEIESRSDLTPLQREKACIALVEQFEQMERIRGFAAEAERKQKEQRAQALSVSGVLGTVGEAAMNSPTVVTSRATAMVNDPAWRAAQRASTDSALQRADAMVAAGIPQAQSRSVLGQLDTMSQAGNTATAVSSLADSARLDATGAKKDTNGSKSMTAEGKAIPKEVDPISTLEVIYPKIASEDEDPFAQDRGKKVYVEFLGSVQQTKKLREALGKVGHQLVSSKSDADVTYLFEGEYTISGTQSYDGVMMSLGALLDQPNVPVATPEKKLMGSISSGFGKLFTAAAAAQGGQLPTLPGAIPEGQIQQNVLVVLARQPRNGKEVRTSKSQKLLSPKPQAGVLGISTIRHFYEHVGFSL